MDYKATLFPIYPKRIAIAIDVLEHLTLPKKAKFNMKVWGEHKGDHEPPDKNLCGTAACGLGWLALSGRLRRYGLDVEWSHDAVDGDVRIWNMKVLHEGNDGADAGGTVFGIPEAIASWLFMPESYRGPVTPKRVAKRLKLVLKGLPIIVDDYYGDLTFRGLKSTV